MVCHRKLLQQLSMDFNNYYHRTSPGGWSQPGRSATEVIQEIIDVLKSDFEKTSKLSNLTKFEALRYWDQEAFRGTRNYCAEVDIGPDLGLVYIEFQQNRNGNVSLTSFLRSWPWMN